MNIQPMLSGGVDRFIIEIQVYNTRGLESKYKKTILRKAVYGKSNTPSSLECQVEDFSILSEGRTIDEISDEFVYKLKSSLKPVKKKSLNNKLIFSPTAFGELLYYTLGQAITGENIARGRSFLSDKIGGEIASERLSLIDWGNSNNFISGRPFDGEGTSTRKNIIVDRGVLKQAIYDIEWGLKTGLESTGNAQRSYYTLPSIGLNTIHIPATSSNSLTHDISKGYYIETISGAHTSNSVTGDFGVVVVGGYLIMNGEISKPIYGPLISSSCISLLNSIVDVGGPEEQAAINQTAVKFSPVLIEF
ncbi:MAG: TldD/PmbA family protein [Candidatus Odinarchaeum yellowstonii]|uniref:TldD/PmbA family protein n=1 Tax=Odinarchaeota yellowstonii (strain LCB_4) TaxID=1841599 RepID=A0AAF0D1G5_ODILC|nr:MAG: TldD/PmbA family protein [Candidatus Odinarchaeum yellowstonii]